MFRQNSCQRPVVSRNARIDNTARAPLSFQREPDLHSRCLIKVLHAASVTPLPMGQLRVTEYEYFIRSFWFSR